MKFQPGDKVSFINEKQQGIVKKVLPGNIVVVEIEDGFDIPVRENELVKIGAVITEPAPEIRNEEPTPLHDSGSVMNLCDTGAICIAAIPDATGGVLTGPLTYYLINRTEFDVVYTFYQNSEKIWKGLQRGICEKNSFQELARYKREDLTGIQSFLIQAFLFSESLPQISAIRNEFGVLIPAIENARNEIQGIAAFASVRTIFSKVPIEEIPVKDLLEKYTEEKKTESPKKSRHSDTSDKSVKYGIIDTEKEVDLHIEELVPDFSGLSNSEIIAIQLRRFSREMDNAMRNHFKRIIFIHGVGNGKLKSEIRKELRLYPNVAFKDGDSRKYGNGATEVSFM